MITKQELHKVEMDLVRLCESREITREDIINRFTDLLNEVKR